MAGARCPHALGDERFAGHRKTSEPVRQAIKLKFLGPVTAFAVVALANKNARFLWAVFVRAKAFDAHHVSVKPGVIAVAVAAGA
jgi:hypothetical protein